MLIAATSFDYYDDPNLFFDTVFGDSTYNTPPVISATAGRNGTPGLAISKFLGGNFQCYAIKNLESKATYGMGAAVCVPEGQDVTSPMQLFSFLDPLTGGPHIAILISPDGHLILASGRTQGFATSYTFRAISSVALTFNVPQYIEFKATIDPTTGSATVKINGTTVISFTGDTTNDQSGSPNTIGGLQVGFKNSSVNGYIQGNGGLGYNVDDLYIIDTTGAHNADLLGDLRPAVRVPNASGTYGDWSNTAAAWAASTAMEVGQQIQDSNGNIQRVTAVTGDAKTGGGAPTWATTGGDPTTDNHVTWEVVGTGANPGVADWMLVSEIPHDGDNSYIGTATAGDKSTFAATNPLPGAGTVAAVQVCAIAKKTDGGPSVLHGFVRSAATDGESSDLSPSTDYSLLAGIFEEDPATSALWTLSAAGACEIGIKKVS